MDAYKIGGHRPSGRALWVALRLLLWTIGAALTLMVLFGAVLGLGSSLVWVLALWLIWLALLAVIAFLDYAWSQGRPGSPPPKMYE
jgi:hypothetical protein